MKPKTAEKLEIFFTLLRGARRSILLLDYDGSMAPFRVDRFQARPYAGVRELLKRIQVQGRTRMAVVTGRPAEEIAPMLALDPPLEVWGLHGAERLYANGRRELEQPSVQAVRELHRLRDALRRDALGGRFENKANAVVMHWRGAPRGKARIIEKKVRSLFSPVAQMDGLRLLDFECGLELRSGRDKGGAVEAILEESVGKAGGVPVAYIGDDITDESAFRAVNRVGTPSLSVLMRRHWRASEAEVWLRPPEELRSFLRRWAEALKG